ncbi:MAG: efflux RND transporter periplasmic adaptor subunit, partial [Phycisphaeraceae bacterium]
MSDREKPSFKWLVLHYVVSLFVCLLLVGFAAAALFWIYSSEPTAQIEGATRKSAALVDTLVVQRGTYEPELVVLGNVQPSREIRLSPLVGGEIIKVNPRFVPGGIVEQGQPLFEIDPADFSNIVKLRESELKQAQAELAIEEGRQSVARKELAALGQEITPANRALVLREPQIDSIKARIASAQSLLDQATLDKKRTRVIAPFDAQIMSRLANLGSQVEPGQSVARLVG